MRFSNKTKLVIIVFLCLISCKEKTEPFEYLMYYNGLIKMWRDPMTEEMSKYVENSDFITNDEDGNLLMKGKYQNGFKVGKWEYHPTDSQALFIDWTKYHSDDYSFEINYPSEWTQLDSKDRPFQASFPLRKDENKLNKYFIILKHKKDDLSLHDYWLLYNKETRKADTVKSNLLRKLIRESGDYYLSTYTIERDGEELFVMNFLGETKDYIYDITYSSLKEDISRKYTIFLDMIKSLRVENQRFFPPYGQKTKIIELKFPPDLRA